MHNFSAKSVVSLCSLSELLALNITLSWWFVQCIHLYLCTNRLPRTLMPQRMLVTLFCMRLFLPSWILNQKVVFEFLQ